MKSPIKVLVADDEDLARQRLEVLLNKHSESRHLPIQIFFAEEGAAALDMIRLHEPDVVFLDVQMPEIDGITVALNIPIRRFSLVFQTAFSEHAVKAFELSATDYLLKPFSQERFDKALQRALHRLELEESRSPTSLHDRLVDPFEPQEIGKSVPTNSCVDPLAKALSEQNIHLEHIAVRVGQRTRFIQLDDIKYFISTEHVTQLFTADSDYACDPSLSVLEERLPPQQFLRIHRNAIVRIKEIVSFQQDGNASVTLKNGIELRVSRERKKILKEKMGI